MGRLLGSHHLPHRPPVGVLLQVDRGGGETWIIWMHTYRAGRDKFVTLDGGILKLSDKLSRLGIVVITPEKLLELVRP